MSQKCIGCGRIFHPTKKYTDSKLCSTCRKNHKKCEICDKEIFVQARTCSKECAYELRKKSWKKSCGTEHNFSKKSRSRKKFEKELLEKEGITNPAQRKEVKEKIKKAFREKYNGIDNPFGVKKIRDQIRKDKEEAGIWIPLNELTEFQIYKRNVYSITKSSLSKFGNKYLKNIKLLELNSSIWAWQKKFTIDHIFSVYEGFKNKISPEIIGSIVNLQVITFSENAKKNKKSTISLHTLNKKYTKFLEDENKIS
jgi:hypothetical protein